MSNDPPRNSHGPPEPVRHHMGLGSSLVAGQVFTIVDNTNGCTLTGTFFSSTSGGTSLTDGAAVTGNLGSTFVINYPGGGDVILTAVNVVPEPATLGLLAVAAGGLLIRRRRRTI